MLMRDARADNIQTENQSEVNASLSNTRIHAFSDPKPEESYNNT